MEKEFVLSTKGIYTAVSGAMAQNRKMETISNNLANVNTTGFKKDQQVFKEYLSAYEKAPAVITIPRVTASLESFYDMSAGDRGFVESNGTFTDFSQGGLRATGSPMDLALEGKGFFEVLTPQGVRMTRNGSFKLDAQGRLVTKQGFPVLLTGEDDPEARIIQLDGQAKLNVTDGGDLFLNNENIGRISMVEPVDQNALHKVGNSLYTMKPNFSQEINRDLNLKVHQGFLEQSNVNVVKEMTDMIMTTRAFESTQKAIKAFDEMNGKLVNSIPSLR